MTQDYWKLQRLCNKYWKIQKRCNDFWANFKESNTFEKMSEQQFYTGVKQ